MSTIYSSPQHSWPESVFGVHADDVFKSDGISSNFFFDQYWEYDPFEDIVHLTADNSVAIPPPSLGVSKEELLLFSNDNAAAQLPASPAAEELVNELYIDIDSLDDLFMVPVGAPVQNEAAALVHVSPPQAQAPPPPLPAAEEELNMDIECWLDDLLMAPEENKGIVDAPAFDPVSIPAVFRPQPPLPPRPRRPRQRWSKEEHAQFLRGLQQCGKGDWKSISREFVTTKSPIQICSHAQKYFLSLASIKMKRKRRS